ncbi:hypothetical protein D3C87_1766720 [compost metagenome]
MRAGKHDDIGLFAILLDETWGDLGEHLIIGNRFAADIAFRHAGEVFGSDEADMTLGGERLDQITRIGALDGTGCCQNRNEAGAGAFGRRFDCRHGADKGHMRKFFAQRGTGKGESGVAGDDADFRLMIF